MDPLCEERVEAKFRRDGKSSMMLFVMFCITGFIISSIGVTLLESPRDTTGVWLFVGAALFGVFALWAGIDSSMYLLEANKLRFAREARAEITAEAKRAEEARKAGS